MSRTYVAFISYKHVERDAVIAKTVHTQIESYIIPKQLRRQSKKLGIVFRDEEELPVSSDLSESIQNALDKSRYLIVICSPEAKASPWVNREINYFLQRHSVNDVFVVLAKGEPADSFPYQLTHIPGESDDEYREIEPLALDARAETTDTAIRRVRKQIRKLYAAMIGCSYDNLVQRDKARRIKKYSVIGICALLLVISFFIVTMTSSKELSRKDAKINDVTNAMTLQESKLLTQRAEEAIRNNETYEAIEAAVAALYDDKTERAYYAPAERVLFSALDLFGNNTKNPLLKKVALQHKSPIEMMAFSQDGQAVFSIDTYGTVSSFDSTSGLLNWSVPLSKNSKEFSLFEMDPQLIFDSTNDSVICYFEDALYGIDALTGTMIWHVDIENRAESLLSFCQEKAEISYIERCYISHSGIEPYGEEYNLVSISTKNGGQTRRIFLQNSFDGKEIIFSAINYNNAKGKYIEEGHYVGTFFVTENSICKPFLYIVDLIDDSVVFIESNRLDANISWLSYLGTYSIGDDKIIIVNNEASKLRISCYDLVTNELLWNSDVNEAPKHISSSADCWVIPEAGHFIVCIDTVMYSIRSDDGSVRSSVTLYDKIVNIYTWPNGMFSFILANGYYAIGWENSTGFHDSQFFGTTLDLHETTLSIAYNNGPLQFSMTDGEIEDGYTVPLDKGGGSIICVNNEKNVAYVVSALSQIQKPSTLKIITHQKLPISLGNYLDATNQAVVLLGPAGYYNEYGIIALDINTHTANIVYPDDYTKVSASHVLLTSDGEKILIDKMNCGDIQCMDLDGNISVISEEEMITLSVYNEFSFYDNKYVSDMARQSKTNKVVSARCDEESIVIWVDAQENNRISIPETIRWAVHDDLQYNRLFCVGENGLLILSDYQDHGDDKVSNFAVYDLNKEEWRTIEDVVHGSSKRELISGKVKPIFAVYDEDMNIRVYDSTMSHPPVSINAGLAVKSIQKLEFCLEDQFIMAGTQDGGCFIYSVADSSIVFKYNKKELKTKDDYSIWHDSINNRMYIRMADTIICVDTRSWEILFSVDHAILYSEIKNELIFVSTNWTTSESILNSYSVPSTQEIIDIALRVLQE